MILMSHPDSAPAARTHPVATVPKYLCTSVEKCLMWVMPGLHMRPPHRNEAGARGAIKFSCTWVFPGYFLKRITLPHFVIFIARENTLIISAVPANKF